MSRFKFVQTVQQIPGQCMLCGKGSDPNGFVDTDMTLDGYGACSICYTCVCGLQEAFGLDAMAKPLITDAAIAGVMELPTQIKEIKDRYDDSFDRLGTYVSGLADHFGRVAGVLQQELDTRSERSTKRADRAAKSARIDQLGLDDDFDLLDSDSPNP